MDGSRFDDLSRTLANSVSRRGVLKLLLVGAMAGVRLVAGEQGAAAQAARKPPGFERLGKRCDSRPAVRRPHPVRTGDVLAPGQVLDRVGRLVDQLDVNGTG